MQGHCFLACSVSFLMWPRPTCLGIYNSPALLYHISEDSSSQTWQQANLIWAVPQLRLPQMTLGCAKLIGEAKEGTGLFHFRKLREDQGSYDQAGIPMLW